MGDIPKTPQFNCFEIANAKKAPEIIKKYGLQGKKIIIDSDAHYLDGIRDKENYFDLDDEPYSSNKVRASLFKELRG